ncbi:hypothetical protein M1L60_42465 [Actinoplanes sp. TRM 88003]|uniref:Helicase ATP-binding domain-containing protein n=1 Tax=Paractinoplanes aksuensis TaxID=2939490 RepID=A0ABT1E295_9ACTN|nr:helicase-related protein [Actinoplanes aksuensis]MCO8277261.1 hypothetical protein [Actinoplanes aksuensis]
MTKLKDFQRDTVAYVMDRWFGAGPTRRFLIADETGMGKSVVAGGIIEELIERLRSDDRVRRIDIVYICSNHEIAGQNLARLSPPGQEAPAGTGRLTLLGLEPRPPHRKRAGDKPVNLVSFTPGTSFEAGWRTGTAEERALIYYLLRSHLLAKDAWDRWREKAALRILQCTSRSMESFEVECQSIRERLDETPFHPGVLRAFGKYSRERKLLNDFRQFMSAIGRRTELDRDEGQRARRLVADLRSALAKAGVEALEPDLVILDEFQRFRGLLDPDNGGEAAELAHHLFDYEHARVLLLSATPYKPFTYAEETDDDHQADLYAVLRFLNPDPRWNADVRRHLAEYRETLLAGEPTATARGAVRQLLLQVMCRTERPPLHQHMPLTEHVLPADNLDAAEIRSWAAMKQLGRELDAPVTLEYWKSAPYFLNFVEGYLLGQHLRTALRAGPSERVRDLLQVARLLEKKDFDSWNPINLGHGKLRRLAEQTVDRGWWKLLWIPPSMPYYRLAEPFAKVAGDGITKRLIFSSWKATPTAVSALLSYDAECRIRRDRPEPPPPRLDYRSVGGQPATMSTLALFWPHPGLAEACDPQEYARSAPDRLVTVKQIEKMCRARLRSTAPRELRATGRGDQQPWRSVLRWPGAWAAPDFSVRDAAVVMHDPQSEDSPVALYEHVQLAHATATIDSDLIRADVDDLVSIGMHAPGNIAWRAVGRLVDERDHITPRGQWFAAAVIADSLRILFNRAESMLLLDRMNLGGHYWQTVLKYCAAGGLQSVLDEYLHVLRSDSADQPLDDHGLWLLALKVEAALTLRPAPYTATNPHDLDEPIRIMSRFALRYGGKHAEDSNRAEDVQGAFNSPFWPFVVTTTSAGQEGIDFHRYCSAVVHWNVPPNPVDFEQREGRVHRFGGHAVRRNVAHHHRAEALRSPERDVWKAAYDAARETSELGDLMPYWLYPGPAAVERHVLPLPLSRDQDRYDRLKRDLALYRLTFGQPRQEDMLALLSRTGVSDLDTEPIDLRPLSADRE